MRKKFRGRTIAVLPVRAQEYLRRRFGRARWGNLRRTTPFSRHFGFDRGTPIDRYYIESFLSAHASDIAGRVLEVKDDAYTRRFGGPRITHSDVLDIDAQNPRATIIADLNAARELPDAAFDCILLTQTLHLIYDFRSAVRELHRSLRAGGILLVTVPGITKMHGKLLETWYWAFTSSSMQRLFEEHFPASHLTVESHGNVLSATAFLHGLAQEELSLEELAVRDPEYQVIVTVRAVKPQT